MKYWVRTGLIEAALNLGAQLLSNRFEWCYNHEADPECGGPEVRFAFKGYEIAAQWCQRDQTYRVQIDDKDHFTPDQKVILNTLRLLPPKNRYEGAIAKARLLQRESYCRTHDMDGFPCGGAVSWQISGKVMDLIRILEEKDLPCPHVAPYAIDATRGGVWLEWYNPTINACVTLTWSPDSGWELDELRYNDSITTADESLIRSSTIDDLLSCLRSFKEEANATA